MGNTITGVIWEVWIDDPYGNRLVPLNTFSELNLSRVINNSGTFSLAIPRDAIDLSLIILDGIIEFWRGREGEKLKWISCGLIRNITYNENSNGLDQVILSGPDVNELLSRRIIAYAAGTSQASKTDYADDLMKDIVRENLGSSAVTGRDLSSLNFTVDADKSLGSSVTKSFSWRNVLEVLREVSDFSVQDSNPIYFDIVPYEVSATQIGLTFYTYNNQIGLDRTYTSSNLILFGKEYGNISDPSLEYNYSDEKDYAFVGGQGDEAARTIVEVSDTTQLAYSPWNRKEIFVDARNESTTQGLTDKGKAALNDKKPRIRFSAKLRDTLQTMYGEDWEFGDKISINYLGITWDGIIKYVNFNVNSEKVENIDSILEG